MDRREMDVREMTTLFAPNRFGVHRHSRWLSSDIAREERRQLGSKDGCAGAAALRRTRSASAAFVSAAVALFQRPRAARHRRGPPERLEVCCDVCGRPSIPGRGPFFAYLDAPGRAD